MAVLRSISVLKWDCRLNVQPNSAAELNCGVDDSYAIPTNNYCLSQGFLVTFCTEHGSHTAVPVTLVQWWRHQMDTISAILVICVWNSLVTGEFLGRRPVTRSCDVFFDLRLNRRLSKHSWGWWFETPWRPLWRHCNDKPFSICVV